MNRNESKLYYAIKAMQDYEETQSSQDPTDEELIACLNEFEATGRCTYWHKPAQKTSSAYLSPASEEQKWEFWDRVNNRLKRLIRLDTLKKMADEDPRYMQTYLDFKNGNATSDTACSITEAASVQLKASELAYSVAGLDKPPPPPPQAGQQSASQTNLAVTPASSQNEFATFAEAIKFLDDKEDITLIASTEREA